MVLRFANAIFEPLWKRVTSITSRSRPRKRSGWKTRPAYYEGAGALRDMVQNHFLQLLCLVAMEPPTDLSADSIRDEKVKVVRSLRRLTRGGDVAQDVVRGAIHRRRDQRQAGSGLSRGEKRQNEVARRRRIVALRCTSTTGAGPTCRSTCASANGLPKSGTEISVHFKKAPRGSLQQRIDARDQNVLVIRIQPDEGISLRMQAKVPGQQLAHRAGEDGFPLRDVFRQSQPGSLRTSAARCDERRRHALRAARRSGGSVGIHRPNRGSLARERSCARTVLYYPAGSWGPEAADELLARDGRAWRRL